MTDVKTGIGMTDIACDFDFDFNGFLDKYDSFKALESEIKAMRESLEAKLRELGNASFKDENFPIQFVYTEGSTRIGLDTKKIQSENPDLWNEIHNTYGKDTTVSDSYKLEDKRKPRKKAC